jgi:hypothetical protein
MTGKTCTLSKLDSANLILSSSSILLLSSVCFFFFFIKKVKNQTGKHVTNLKLLSLPLFFVSIICELENLTERKTAKISPTIQVASMVTLNIIFLISFIQEIILIFQLKLYIKIP